MDRMGNMRRTHYSVAVKPEMAGQEVVVAGFIAKARDLGAVVFCDVFEKAKTLRSEYVVMAKGIVALRESENKDIETGKVEILVKELILLSKAETAPFEIKDGVKVNDELKLKYRYLDLRRPEVHEGLIFRHKI